MEFMDPQPFGDTRDSLAIRGDHLVADEIHIPTTISLARFRPHKVKAYFR
jgi:hypothetical protein